MKIKKIDVYGQHDGVEPGYKEWLKAELQATFPGAKVSLWSEESPHGIVKVETEDRAYGEEEQAALFIAEAYYRLEQVSP